MDEPVGEVAAVDTAIETVGLAGGVRLITKGLPGGGEGRTKVDAVLVVEVTEDHGKVACAWQGALARVIEVDGAGLETDHDADPVTAANIDWDEELVEVKDGASRWCHLARPVGDVGVVVGATDGWVVMELLGK